MIDEDSKFAIQEWQLDTMDEGMVVFGDFERRYIIPDYQAVMPRDLSLGLLYQKMGMPCGLLTPAAVSIPGREYGNDFKNFRIELFGLRGALKKGKLSQHPELSKTESEYCAGAYGVFEFPNNNIMSLHIWRVRIFVRDASLYVEQLWHTEKAKWMRNVFNLNASHGVEVEEDSDNLRLIADSLPLLHLTLGSVQPHTLKQENLISDAYQAIYRFARNQARRAMEGKQRIRRDLNKKSLAAEIGCSRDSIYTLINNNPGLWQHFLTLFRYLIDNPSIGLEDALNELGKYSKVSLSV